MTRLSAGWVLARVGDLVEFSPKNHCADNADVGFVPLHRLGVDYRSRHSFATRPWADVKKGYTHFADGDVLLARITPSFENGKAGIVRDLPNGVGAGSTEYFVCRPDHGALLPEYLLAHFKTPQFLRDGEQVMSGAVGQQRVPKQYVLDSRIPLAPLAEQQRIAEKLDAVLARVDASRERLDRVPDILKRFRQAVVAAATSGRLTGDWRGCEQHDRWGELALVDLSEKGRVITYGVIKLGKEIDDGVPCLRTSNVRWLRIDTEGMKRIDRDLSSSYSRTILHGGEVLVNVRGTLGGVAVAGPEMAGWNVSREVAVVPVDNKLVDPSFLAYWIGSDASQRWLGRVEKGVAYVGINIEDLRNLPVGIPSLEEQQEIVRRVESLFSYADRLEARYVTGRAQVDHLTPAMLAKAFRGELVPQDPDDEPATILLERIRAARAAAPVSPRQRKGGGRPGKTYKAEVIVLNCQDIERNHLTAILKERGPLTAEALWSASQLGIDDFYDQLKAEQAHGLLIERRGGAPLAPRLLEAAS